MKKILFLVISLFTLLILSILLLPKNIKYKIYIKTYCLTTNYKNNAKTINKKAALFYIHPNEPIQNILNSLQQKNIIKENQKNKLICFITKNNVAQNIKAGYFIIKPQMNFNILTTKLQNPEQAIIKITIPEGLRIDQVATILEKNLNNNFNKFTKEMFLKYTQQTNSFKSTFTFLPPNIPNLEGFLFPDTYEFNKFTTTPQEVIKTMLQNFQTKALPILKQQTPYDNKLNLTYYKKLIIASIIERETNKKLLERKMVADIIYKRLLNKMPLQIDATLLYPKKDWTHLLTYRDIHENNPYNTYIHNNLPPTPICNPSLTSIQATNNPKKNPYFYYLHDKNRKIHYASTYYQHIINIKTYLK